MKHIIFILFASLLLIHAQSVICAQLNTSSKHQLSTQERVSGNRHTSDVFYSVIIDNNIFRLLGWQPAQKTFPYKLIASITYTDGKRKASAIIQETTTEKKTYYVFIGDTIGDMSVINIQPKQVTLNKAGENIILNITQQYLNPPREIKKQTDKTQQAEVKNKNRKLSDKNMTILQVTQEHGRINPPSNGIIFRIR